ncbi:MAG: ABC transporter ATP-binding protein [Myxococcota bacterium]
MAESEASSALIALEDITKTYVHGDVQTQVLRGIDLTIWRGEYVAIMGRSGAGKSTLMNILGCLDRPTAGRYVLDGRDISRFGDDELSEVRGRSIGFVFQSFHLLSNLTATQNVELPMEYQGVPAKERAERAIELLEHTGLGHRLGYYPNQLSGGERQRVAIARALSNRPKVLLADEPTGNLDSEARRNVLRLFEELLARSELTLIMVTHDELIGQQAQRCVLVEDGRVVDSGERA